MKGIISPRSAIVAITAAGVLAIGIVAVMVIRPAKPPPSPLSTATEPTSLPAVAARSATVAATTSESDVYSEDLRQAIADDDLNKVGQLIVNDPRLIHAKVKSPPFDGSATILAAFLDHFEILDLLLSRGADANARDKGQATALHVAVHFGKIEAVQTLLEHHADPNLTDGDEWTPLGLALIGANGDLRKYHSDASPEDYRTIAALLRQHGAKLTDRESKVLSVLNR